MSEFAGHLRERIAFERRSDERDILAGVRGKWRYDGAAWAAVTPLGAGDICASAALKATRANPRK